MKHSLSLCLALTACASAHADEAFVKAALARTILPESKTLKETQAFLRPKLPKLPAFQKAEDWQKYADRLRQDILDRAVLRGEAKAWAKAKTEVKYLDTIKGGEGYSIRKLRYEALPGMWVPALLYVPDRIEGKVPVMLAVNGHDRNGKAADYKQTRCINLARRGMIVLNVEWFGMGQLRGAGDAHGCMNQLDLCGTSGLAPFYLAMKRGLDVLLAQEKADPKRVAVSGLSGGGWQTIVISSLDTRVTLANPVAGYSGFKVRMQDHYKDLGDSEQTPVDLATVADYTHLTALRAPHPTLLTYNAKDDCCFEAGYALPPLMAAARPAFKLFGKEKALRSHVNHDPGTHNFGKENREALYKMVGDFFYPDDRKFDSKEIECNKELKTADELFVEVPKGSATFNSLARGLAKDLPRGKGDRKELRQIVKAGYSQFEAGGGDPIKTKGETSAWLRKVQLGSWLVPVVELKRGEPKKTAILLNDAGRAADVENAERLLKAGYRVLAIDLFGFGECRVGEAKRLGRDNWLFMLLVSAVGERPLGIQADQLRALANWSNSMFKAKGVEVVTVGPRVGLVALVAAALEEKAITAVELHGGWKSLKELIEKNRTVDTAPEAFCFGLLEKFDIPRLVELVKPREVRTVGMKE